METNRPTRPVPTSRQPLVVRGALVAAVALLAFLAALIIVNRDDEPASSPPAGPAAATSAEGLRSFAASAGHDVYWAGPQENRTYELTKTSDGRVFIRYLPSSAKPGDRRPRFLTVGTYPRKSAFADLRRAARAKGAVSLPLERGGLMVFSEATPKSVYMGYPNAAYQVEVFHPSAAVARRLVLSGQVRPIR